MENNIKVNIARESMCIHNMYLNRVNKHMHIYYRFTTDLVNHY